MPFSKKTPIIFNKPSILVLYAYYETDYASENLKFFIEHALTNSTNITFVFIISNYKCSVKIPVEQPNIIIYRRENSGYEFGAYADYIQNNKKILTEYSYFINIQASLRGPFLPNYIPKDLHWTQLFINLLTDNVHLVGTTINCLGESDDNLHLQGPLLITDKIGIPLLYKLWLTSFGCDKDHAIGIEIQSTRTIIEHGYNIASMMLYWKGHNFLDRPKTKEKCKWLYNNGGEKTDGDVYFDKCYANINVNPLEVMFFKVNRGVLPEVLEKYTEFVNNQ